MAAIRTRNGKDQVLIGRQGSPDLGKTFINRRDAELWARQKDAEIDRSEYGALDLLKQPLHTLIQRYLESVRPLKKSAPTETYRVKRLLRDSIADIAIRQLGQSHLAEFRIAALKETKNGDDREAPLTKAAVTWIEQLPKGKPHLFPISADAVRQSWRRLVDRAGGEDLRFHDRGTRRSPA